VRILASVLRGELNVRLSAALVDEYREVLKRPRIARRHGLSAAEIDAIVDAILAKATLIEVPELPVEGPDPNDAHLWRLLRCVADATLITGDRALLAHTQTWCNVLTPRDWWTRYGEA